MKPKDLKVPFVWEERHVLLKDQVFYVPNYYDKYETYTFPGWSDPQLFGNDRPVHIEYCSGNGAWIAEKAKADPGSNWVALEKRFDRVRKIWAKKQNFQLDNLVIVHGEALAVSQLYFPDHSATGIYVNFPDPWPKDRHAKHRIIQAPFVKEMARLLCENGEATLVTDDATYSEQMVREMRACPQFESFYPDPYYSTEFSGYGTSWFEDLWREQGRVIHYHRFRQHAKALAGASSC